MNKALLVVILLLTACAPPARHLERDLSAISGTWEGVGHQANATSWRINVEISKKSAVGGIAATVSYPGLRCGGTWKLRQAGQKRFALLETISYGLDTCIKQVLVSLELGAEKKELAVTYTGMGNEPDAHATAILTLAD
jgi:hypothetical protein